MSWLRYRYEDGHIVGVFDNGKELLIDATDLETVSSRQWCIDSLGYPSATHNGKTTRLHRILLDGGIPKGMVIDHINRNKLDNRRSNLRVCTQKENNHNVGLRGNNTSGVTGVFYDKCACKWRTQIYHNGKTQHVGVFDDFEDAVEAGAEAEKKYYGGEK